MDNPGGGQVLFGGFADACIRSGNLKLLWKQYQQLLKTGHPVQVRSGQTFWDPAMEFEASQHFHRTRTNIPEFTQEGKSGHNW